MGGGFVFSLRKQKDAQTILEYIILVGIVAVILAAMQPLVKRGIQSIVKVTADQLGQQSNADQTVDEDKGYLLGTFSDRRGRSSKEVGERRDDAVKEYIYRDMTWMHTNAITRGPHINQTD